MRLSLYVLTAMLIFSGCKKTSANGEDGDTSWPSQPPLPTLTGEASFSLAASEDHINVMETFMPRMPAFPKAKRKELIMNGYVADLAGKPVRGAFIGLRSPGTVYIAASATTDANGYYQMNIPLGGADLYAAGYTIDYGTGGRAALSLYPSDGSKILENPSQGVVKNFVVLSYGLADANERATRPWSAAGYFGGSLRFDYSIYDNMWNPRGLPAGEEVELKLTPMPGTTMYNENKTFTVYKKIGSGNGNFLINNIPIGKYTIVAKLKDGRQLKMIHSGPYASQYPHQGLQPAEAIGSASVLFTPVAVEAGSPPPNYGYWRPVAITLQLPI